MEELQARLVAQREAAAQARPAPPSRTKWTRLVHPSVLTGHVSSLCGALPRCRLRTEALMARAGSAQEEARLDAVSQEAGSARGAAESALAGSLPPHPVLTGHAASLPPY